MTNFYFVSEVLRYKMCEKIEKNNLKFREDVILELTDLAVSITIMVV